MKFDPKASWKFEHRFNRICEKRGLLVALTARVWLKNSSGEIVRFLSTHFYDEAGNERHLCCRVALDDPRRFEHKPTWTSTADSMAEHPVGEWVEFIVEYAKEAA